MHLRSSAVAVALCALIAAAPAAAEPKLTVETAKLDAALHCTDGIDDAARTPLMIVTGTGASGAEAYGIIKPALDLYGAPVCYVDFPNFTTADVQVSVQYLVRGLRVMSRRAGRRVAIVGISQGGLLPRIALTYWPSLRAKVSDVVAAAGTRTARRSAAALQAQSEGLHPGGLAAGGRIALPASAECPPGRDARPDRLDDRALLDDETVQPQTGAHPTSSLKGATNVLIQHVCPGREVSPHRHRARLRHVGRGRGRGRPRRPRASSPGCPPTSARTRSPPAWTRRHAHDPGRRRRAQRPAGWSTRSRGSRPSRRSGPTRDGRPRDA